MKIRDLIIELLQYDLDQEIYVDASSTDSDSYLDLLSVDKVYTDAIDRVYIETDK